MSAVKILIEEEITVALERALIRKTLCAFGEDGFGKYGRKDTPSYFDVVDLRIDIEEDETFSPPTLSGKVSICLRGYNAADVGHVVTDQNFEISLRAALTAAGLSKDSLAWASIEEQVDGCATFHIDIAELLGW